MSCLGTGFTTVPNSPEASDLASKLAWHPPRSRNSPSDRVSCRLHPLRCLPEHGPLLTLKTVGASRVRVRLRNSTHVQRWARRSILRSWPPPCRVALCAAQKISIVRSARALPRPASNCSAPVATLGICLLPFEPDPSPGAGAGLAASLPLLRFASTGSGCAEGNFWSMPLKRSPATQTYLAFQEIVKIREVGMRARHHQLCTRHAAAMLTGSI